MAKAAYCAMCGHNVYVNDEGTCPQGHPADQLTSHYDVPELTPAERALHDASAPAEKRQLNRSLMIALLLAGFIVLCGLSACVAGLIGFGNIGSLSSGITPDEFTDAPSTDAPVEIDTDANNDSPEGFDPSTEFGSLTSHFFSGFSPISYYSIGDTSSDPAMYQVLVTSDSVSGFRMIFTVLRYANDPSGDIDQKWVYGGSNGATWRLVPDGGDEYYTSLSDFVGPAAAVDRAVAEQVMTDFAAAHPTLIVSNFELGSGLYVLRGFDESELDDWMGDSTSFESWWEPDPAATGEWIETSF